MQDTQRLRALMALCKRPVRTTCSVVYDWYASREHCHIFGRGFVLVNRFATRQGEFHGGSRLVLMRDGRLVVQLRTGAGEWRAGWTAAGRSTDMLRDGVSYYAEPLEERAETLLLVYPIEEIAKGCARLLRARERILRSEMRRLDAAQAGARGACAKRIPGAA